MTSPASLLPEKRCSSRTPRLDMVDVSKWTLFSLLSPDFVSSVRLACIYGSSGNEALLITREDDVFVVGSNCSGALGLGDTPGSLEPRKIDVLCGKKICDLAYGSGPHVLALTLSGEVYAWGHNGYCQLGNGNTTQGLPPVIVSGGGLAGKHVVRVACGSHHSVLLTIDGELFAWGQNNCGQVGSGSTANQPTPRKVTTAIGGRLVVDVSCGQTSTMVVLDNGEVYGWGYNGNGQLGLGSNTNQPNPSKVQGLQGVIVVKVACGYAHTMALSDEGALYVWGANSYGQLGTGNKANQVAPVRIAADKGRFADIAATHYGHLSAAFSQTAQVYIWGQCRGLSVCSPRITPFPCMDLAFACFSTPAISWRPITVDISSHRKVSESVKEAFDDPVTSDVKISVEGKVIHAHKSILKIRSEHFRSMFTSAWGEDDKDTVEIPVHSHAVYRAYLHYLYTDFINVTPEEAIGLLDVANAYCESQLKRQCERTIKQGISVDNAAMLYAAAIKFDAKELEDFCFRFCFNHMTAITQTQAFADLEEGTVKDFITKAAQLGAFKH